MGARRAGLVLLAFLAAGCGGGREAATPPAPAGAATIALRSPAFAAGARLPRALSCQGAGRAPALSWRGVPAAAQELVLAVEDPDAPGGTFVHWTVFGLPPATHGLPAGGRLPAGAASGANSTGSTGWTPPCPPQGDEPHHYVFTLFALRRPSGLRSGASPSAVRAALAAQRPLARGRLVGTYSR
jgi:Raf kinase inhibitor-like YbhB/YbcL family protein